jgi:DNA-binding GntR family transcriptional regulator
MANLFEFERDRAYRSLLELILAGSLDPSEPLSERGLAETLEVGRTPVREALRDLARDGILEVRPARGTYLRPLSAVDVREIYEVRVALEGLAAELAARRGPTPELAAYGLVFRDMLARPDAHDVADVYETGARFHLDVFRAAGNRQLLALYEPLRLRFRVALALPRFFDPDRVRESVAEHLAILDAIAARDAALAQRLIRAHLERGADVRGRIVAEIAKAGGPTARVPAER